MEFPRLPLAAYTVAWICALSVELKAALAMLDKEHQDPPAKPQETNSYCLGSIGRHNVVIVCPPSGRYGTNAAADCVGRMMEKFPSVKYGFLVGIAGGVPTDKDDIRLGDVVISQPQGLHGGAIQHDLQKIGAGGKSIRTGYLSPPPTTLLNALTKFQTSGKDRRSHIEERLLLVNAVEKPKSDILYESTYHHVGLDECSDCDPTKVKQRGAPKPTIVHYGLVASGNSVVKDGVTRDRLSRELGGALCFEMEAAGVMNSLPCLVIRGICDYCDSHKNKEWQSYAAVVAAICAREFFEIMPAVQVDLFAADEKERSRFESIFLTDPIIDRASIISIKGARVHGTCEWIRDNEAYKSWLHTPGVPFLWICGAPGKGKTMLSIFLTEELEKLYERDLVFFFCSHEDEKRSSATAVLRGLIYQVIKKKQSLFRHANYFFQSREKAEYLLKSPDGLWSIFRDMVQDPDIGLVSCVIDGLDECDEESMRFLSAKISQMFASNEKPPSPGFRLLISSRRIHGMRSSQTIKLDPGHDEQVYSDIQQFVRCRVQELGKVPGFNPELAAHVEETLLERSERTFLWVGLVMNELLQKSTCADLLFTLETLPKSLPGIYDQVLLRVNEQKRQVVVSTLIWVTLAKRPLTMDELSGAINVQFPAILDRHQTIMDHISFCQPLLRVQGEEIGLIHKSIRDYLLRDPADPNPTLEGIRICPEKGHYAIAQACLKLVEKGGERIPEVPSQRAAILNYAIEAWSHHAKHAGAYSDRIFDMSRPMFRQGSRIAHHWIKCFFEADDEKISKLTSLHIASIFDLTPWARGLLAQKKWKISIILYLGMRNTDGYTALHLSACGGCEATTQFLLENGANPKAQSHDGSTPLSLAVVANNENVVRILLSYCWNINHKNKEGETPLTISVYLKNTNMARFLIANGADVNMKGHAGATLLIMSVFGNSLEISELLIKHGADIEGQDNIGSTALLASVLENNLEMCRILTSYGANVNKGPKELSPFQVAVKAGFDDIAELLIKRGAEMNSTNEFGMTPLEWAMRNGRASTMRMLLSHGADLGKLDRNGIGSVILAVSFDPEVTIPILVEFGADVNERGRFGTTSLLWAAHWGNIAAVEVLLRYNPDIHATHDGETARQRAARMKHHDVVRMLDEYERQLLKTNEDACPPAP